MRLQVKPLSVNQCWQGKRFKTETYKAYEKMLLYILPKVEIPEGKLKISFVFGFSNSGADIDNCVKPLQDIMSKKYDFNDNRIYEQTVKKVIVKKGQEFFEFSILSFEN
ncbi:hypothetical protein [Flavobacterium sp.]|uniref:hypothetical protein n=1 Tax=Flavobacterium sp. TaxID=239 RepID=UPI003751AEE1